MTDETLTSAVNVESIHLRPIQKLLNREAQRLRELRSVPKGMTYGEVLTTIDACETVAETLRNVLRSELT